MDEEDVFDIIRTNSDNGGGDGSEFLNDHGPGMEPEHRDTPQTSIECDDDDSEIGERPPQSGEVY